MKPSVVGIVGMLATFVPAGASPAHAQSEPCPKAGGDPVVLAAVEPRLELRLGDGRLVKLAGLEAVDGTPTAPDRGDAAREALAVMLKGHGLLLQTRAARPDRWARTAAFAYAADGPLAGRPGGIAAVAIGAGFGRYRAEPSARSCRAVLLSAEDAARRAGLGLWGDPYYSVLAVDDRAGFAERAGSNVLVEARLLSVEPGPYRTRLRFAASDHDPHEGRRLSATIQPRAMKLFEVQGVDFTSLIGRTLRLRGLLDERFGPQIELGGPDDVEILPPLPSHSN